MWRRRTTARRSTNGRAAQRGRQKVCAENDIASSTCYLYTFVDGRALVFGQRRRKRKQAAHDCASLPGDDRLYLSLWKCWGNFALKPLFSCLLLSLGSFVIDAQSEHGKLFRLTNGTSWLLIPQRRYAGSLPLLVRRAEQ